MVLQDLGDQPSDSFGGGLSPSDSDPYSSSTPSIDYDSLPQAFPIIGPLIGFKESITRYRTNQTIEFAQQRIGRTMTSSEAQALAYHLYDLEQKRSYWATAGVAAGVGRWYMTMSINRYPMYLPKPEDINPNRFMFVRGPLAQYARHSWRLTLYIVVGSWLGRTIGTVVAQPAAAQNTAKDPALAQFSQDLAAANATGQNRRVPQPNQVPQGRQEGAGPQELPPHAGAPRWPRRQPPPKPMPSAEQDDSSPTAGNDLWSYGNSPAFAPEPTPQQQQPRQASQSFDPFGEPSRGSDDDMSPTGGMFQDEVQNQSRPGESAWDRLRRGERGPAPQRPPFPRRPDPAPKKEQTEGSTLGDSFMFAESDEERRRAQLKAQREFDERLERERQGKDFNDEKRW